MKQNMTFEEFVTEVKENLNKYVLTAGEVVIEKCGKLNESGYVGVSIRKPDTSISPNVNLNLFYEENYKKDGKDIEKVLMEIAELYDVASAEIPNRDKIFAHFKEYDFKRIVPIVIDVKLNFNMKDLPHINLYDDFMLIGKYRVDDNECEDGIQTTTISDAILALMGIKKEDYLADLLKVAMLQKYTVTNLESVLMTMVKETSFDDEQSESLENMLEELIKSTDHIPRIVVSTKSKLFGATAIANKDVFRQIAEKTKQEKLYILPSSIHELIVVPAGYGDILEMKDMVKDVNNTQVADDEILSYNVLVYTLEKNEIKVY